MTKLGPQTMQALKTPVFDAISGINTISNQERLGRDHMHKSDVYENSNNGKSGEAVHEP